MAKISFNKNTPSDQDTGTAVAHTEPDERQLTAPGHYGEYGEVTSEDINTPYFSLVGKTGDLADDFKPGTFCFNKLAQLEGPLSVVVLTLRKRYSEALPYGGDERPRTFNTAAEVQAAGLRVGKPTSSAYGEEAKPEAPMLLFVCMPEGYNDENNQFLNALPSGQLGALGLFTARGSSYMSTAGSVFTALNQNLVLKANGVHSQKWTLKSNLAKNDKNSWWTAQLSPGAKLTQEDADYLRDFIPSVG